MKTFLYKTKLIKRFLPLICFILILPNISKAQTPLVGIEAGSFFGALNDTVLMSSSQPANIRLVIQDPGNTLSSQIPITTGVDSSQTGNILITTDTATVFVSPAFDTVYTTFNINIDPSFFRTGINTVVIWPVASTPGEFNTRDSLFENVFVNFNANLQSITIKPLIIGPNPFSNTLHIMNLGGSLNFGQVRIWNNIGELVYSLPVQNKLDLNVLNSGIYFVELIDNGGSSTKFKVIKQ